MMSQMMKHITLREKKLYALNQTKEMFNKLKKIKNVVCQTLTLTLKNKN